MGKNERRLDIYAGKASDTRAAEFLRFTGKDEVHSTRDGIATDCDVRLLPWLAGEGIDKGWVYLDEDAVTAATKQCSRCYWSRH